MKLSIKILLPLLILLLSFYGFTNFKKYAKTVKDEHCLSTQISSRIVDFNSFKLVNHSNIDTNVFKLVNKNSGKTIFENGKFQKGIKNEYGNCTFELYQDDVKIYDFGHFKTDNWRTYDYVLKLDTQHDSLVVSLSALNAKLYKLFYKKID